MKIPVNPTMSGDLVRARLLRGRAMKELHVLEEFMAFQDLQQCKRRVPISYDKEAVESGIIELEVHFGIRTIHIHVEPYGGGDEDYEQACLCNCNFTTGWVLEKQSRAVGSASLYTVKACFAKKRFRTYKDVLASDFAEYLPGQMVIMIPYRGFSFLCCTDTPDITGCNPSPPTDLSTSSSGWRTTYRIIPWNAFTLPKLINVKRTVDGIIR